MLDLDIKPVSSTLIQRCLSAPEFYNLQIQPRFLYLAIFTVSENGEIDNERVRFRDQQIALCVSQLEVSVKSVFPLLGCKKKHKV